MLETFRMDSKNRLSLGADVVKNLGRQYSVEIGNECIILKPLKDKSIIITRGRKRKIPLPIKKLG